MIDLILKFIVTQQQLLDRADETIIWGLLDISGSDFENLCLNS